MRPDSSDSPTFSSAGETDSVPLELPVVKATVGGSSLSWMVYVYSTVVPIVALTAPLRASWNVSSVSSMASSATVTEISSSVSPGAKVRVPLCRV